MRKPCARSHCRISHWLANSRPSAWPTPYVQIDNGRAAVIAGSSCRTEPAAALRGFGAAFLPSASCFSVNALNPESGMNTSPRTSTSGGRDLPGLRLHRERYGPDRAQVRGHVLAALAVATRRAPGVDAVLVEERHREAVDLRLDQVGDRLVRAEPLPHVVRELREASRRSSPSRASPSASGAPPCGTAPRGRRRPAGWASPTVTSPGFASSRAWSSS